MPWVRVECGFARHPKVIQLGRKLAELTAEGSLAPQPEVFGLVGCGVVTRLWAWAGELGVGEDGVLPEGTEAEDIAAAVGWPYLDTASRCVTLLSVTGLIEHRDGHFFLHDWADWQGKGVDQVERRRALQRERTRRYRNRQKQSSQEDSDPPERDTQRDTERDTSRVTERHVSRMSRTNDTIRYDTLRNVVEEEGAAATATTNEDIPEDLAEHLTAGARGALESILRAASSRASVIAELRMIAEGERHIQPRPTWEGISLALEDLRTNGVRVNARVLRTYTADAMRQITEGVQAYGSGGGSMVDRVKKRLDERAARGEA